MTTAMSEQNTHREAAVQQQQAAEMQTMLKQEPLKQKVELQQLLIKTEHLKMS